MKIRSYITIKSSTGNGRRLAALAAPTAISVWKQPEASRKNADGRLTWERYLTFVSFLAAPGKTLSTWLVIAASTWSAIGTGVSLHEIAKQSGRVRTEEIRLSGLD